MRQSAEFIHARVHAHIPVILENPVASMLWLAPPIRNQLGATSCQITSVDQCQFGARWRKTHASRRMALPHPEPSAAVHGSQRLVQPYQEAPHRSLGLLQGAWRPMDRTGADLPRPLLSRRCRGALHSCRTKPPSAFDATGPRHCIRSGFANSMQVGVWARHDPHRCEMLDLRPPAGGCLPQPCLTPFPHDRQCCKKKVLCLALALRLERVVVLRTGFLAASTSDASLCPHAFIVSQSLLGQSAPTIHPLTPPALFPCYYVYWSILEGWARHDPHRCEMLDLRPPADGCLPQPCLTPFPHDLQCCKKKVRCMALALRLERIYIYIYT